MSRARSQLHEVNLFASQQEAYDEAGRGLRRGASFWVWRTTEGLYDYSRIPDPLSLDIPWLKGAVLVCASPDAVTRCPHCGVVCPDPDVERWLTEHRPVCTVKPT